MQLFQLGGSLLLLTLLTACGSSSSADELTKELQKVTSWAATAQMAGDAWLHANVPTVYATDTLSKAQQNLHKETETFSHLSTDPTQGHKIIAHLQQIESTVGQMSTAVKQKDHTAMTQQLKQLSTQQQTLTKIAKSVGSKDE